MDAERKALWQEIRAEAYERSLGRHSVREREPEPEPKRRGMTDSQIARALVEQQQLADARMEATAAVIAGERKRHREQTEELRTKYTTDLARLQSQLAELRSKLLTVTDQRGGVGSDDDDRSHIIDLPALPLRGSRRA